VSRVDGSMLIEVCGGVVYAAGVPIYTYADGILVDAQGGRTLLLAGDGKPLGPLELAIAVAAREGYGPYRATMHGW